MRRQEPKGEKLFARDKNVSHSVHTLNKANKASKANKQTKKKRTFEKDWNGRGTLAARGLGNLFVANVRRVGDGELWDVVGRC